MLLSADMVPCPTIYIYIYTISLIPFLMGINGTEGVIYADGWVEAPSGRHPQYHLVLLLNHLRCMLDCP